MPMSSYALFRNEIFPVSSNHKVSFLQYVAKDDYPVFLRYEYERLYRPLPAESWLGSLHTIATTVEVERMDEICDAWDVVTVE